MKVNYELFKEPDWVDFWRAFAKALAFLAIITALIFGGWRKAQTSPLPVAMPTLENINQ